MTHPAAEPRGHHGRCNVIRHGHHQSRLITTTIMAFITPSSPSPPVLPTSFSLGSYHPVTVSTVWSQEPRGSPAGRGGARGRMNPNEGEEVIRAVGGPGQSWHPWPHVTHLGLLCLERRLEKESQPSRPSSPCRWLLPGASGPSLPSGH